MYEVLDYILRRWRKQKNYPVYVNQDIVVDYSPFHKKVQCLHEDFSGNERKTYHVTYDLENLEIYYLDIIKKS